MVRGSVNWTSTVMDCVYNATTQLLMLKPVLIINGFRKCDSTSFVLLNVLEATAYKHGLIIREKGRWVMPVSSDTDPRGRLLSLIASDLQCSRVG